MTNTTQDPREMWASLGLNLEAHDGLLATLGQFFQTIFLSQDRRPARMAYFDQVLVGIHDQRIRELLEAKAQGRPVVGTFCLYVPEEIILAVDGIGVGLCAGADVAAEAVEQVLPRNTCALIKSFFGFKLAGVCPYVEACDFVVGETTCDGKKKAYELFDEYKPTFVMEVPHTKSAAAHRLWRSELERLVEKLESVSGKKVTAEGLARGVEIVNARRAALARLATLRGAVPSPISGRDALLVNQVAFYDDPVRFTEKLNLLCEELEARVAAGEGACPPEAARVLVSGCPMAAPNWKLHFVLEKSGAVVVGEESCVGERGWRNQVTPAAAATRDGLLDAIAERYMGIDCACFTPNDDRLGNVTDMARRYRAGGVVHYGLNFCTPYAIEALRVERALRQEGLPFLKVETDYSMEDMPQLETRVQAFLEILHP